MGKRKRLHTISTSEAQGPVEMELSSEARPSDMSQRSHQQHSTLCEPTNSLQSDYGPPKKVRSYTRKQDIWDLESDERILVTFNKNGQPVGDEGNELTNFLGTLMKMSQHVSLEYLDWRKIPKEKKEDLWSIVKAKFSFSPSETVAIRKWVESDMALKFKSWKYEVKKKSFDSSSTIDDIVATQDDSRVDKAQFKKLVTHWFKKETQMESEMKRKIRSKSNEPHVTGTKSFARLIHDETKKNNGVQPSRGTIYCISRTQKDGKIVNASAAEVVEKLKNITDRTTSSTNAGGINWKNDDLAQVKGPERGGRIRCLGKVVMANVRGSCSSQDPQVPILKARVNELEDELKEMREKQEAMVRFMAIVREQLPNANLPNIFNGLNIGVNNFRLVMIQLVYNQCPNGNSTLSRASEDQNSVVLRFEGAILDRILFTVDVLNL